MTNINPKLRFALYIAVAAVGGILVTYGIVTQDLINSLLPVLAGVLAITGGGTAAANTDFRTRDQLNAQDWIAIGAEVGPEILSEINKLRSQVAAIPAGSHSPVDDMASYVPEVAPWLDNGRHAA